VSATKSQWTPVKYAQTQLGAGVTSQGVSFAGGLDLTTPTLRLQAGALRDCLNFEVGMFGGYSRIDGYERVDGQAAPSAATYTVVWMAAPLTTVPTVGQVVTQAATGATGTIIAVQTRPPPTSHLLWSPASSIK
jgi:hypothetical protein